MELREFKSIIDLLKAFPDEQSCIDHLTQWRWEGKVVSPFDPESKVYVCKNNKYKCRNTNKYFNVKTGTIFEDSKIPLQKWFLANYVFSSHKKGISSHQLAKDIDVTQKTAWFMLHRLRYAFNHPKYQETLTGTIEADETFMGGQAPNMHEKRKEYNEDGSYISKKVPVLGMRQRNGNVIAKVIKHARSSEIHPLLFQYIEKKSILYTDQWSGYVYMKYIFKHKSVNHSAKQYVDGMCHTNGIENFWSHLKRGITGIYHWASIKHLQAYVNEYSLRFNTRELKTSERFNVVLSNINGRLTYQMLIAK
jgi:transposase-like protein